MMIAAWIDGVAADAVSLADRGLHYGDAAFTTIRVHAAHACWVDRHIARLQRACERLRLPPPPWTMLADEIARAGADARVGVIKIMLSRGDGARGYAPIGNGRRIMFCFAPVSIDAAMYRDGVAVRLADLRLSDQPLLAGIKHANRLEQVLARGEWNDPAIYESLLCDARDELVSATSANVFARFGNELRTPSLAQSGVAGVCREQVIVSPPRGFSVTVAAVRRDDLHTADELFLSNALRGIVPVRALGDHRYAAHTAAHALMRDLHPALGLPAIV